MLQEPAMKERGSLTNKIWGWMKMIDKIAELYFQSVVVTSKHYLHLRTADTVEDVADV